MHFSTLDYVVFISYIVFIVGLGLYVSREKKGHKKNSSDYFLASKALPWWAIGFSLIAANISAEQYIGMSGSGYVIGLGIATYEWTAAITLIVVAKYFLPIFLKEGIYTMPQLLEIRYDSRVRTGLAVFWLLLYVFVNLTSVLYLGALALRTILGVPLIWGIAGLALFSALYTIYGGLKAVVWTDVVQVLILIIGGLVTTYFALDQVSGGQGAFAGFSDLMAKVPEKFDMILDKSNPNYAELPGLGVLLGGMWMAHFFYWGCNQYIIQRALAAKSIKEAQRGLMFGGYLKILTPLIVVIPGIVAYALSADLAKPDEAYPWLLSTFVPTGLKGLAFAALIAAIVSSLSSMVNSTATIFSMDIYKQIINKDASEERLVFIGRVTSAVALIVAVIIAPSLSSLEQAFQFIQEFTGFISPGIFAIFIFGLFWKKATANSAVWAAVLTIPLSLAIKFFIPALPFLNRMGVVFLILSAIVVIITLIEKKGVSAKAIKIDKDLFHTDTVFNVGAIGIFAILSVLYTIWW
ncbi:MAG: sodium/solute symporter [Candidatus Marinimicrobia bacterium]|jgi:SSS family solute:Na+ symporter|nr:sodium/solute symporter [Candidatus Neomarinimicrobiota bacterium]MBT3576320.1 sodium/solute symporter [Candidatus Neomarinimicrobiota bacterium]MBT3825523.1 sodium/solute symporter [Candidatus Neomarinimicrobiota bacterium]MBT4129621.1 sodium/solute symporter [Candidatus Neomarinimicrobiota bacterium]MBT4294524.1 sodium/solute symporter [Candidatus Neomarinimicrobiota bacterium]